MEICYNKMDDQILHQPNAYMHDAYTFQIGMNNSYLYKLICI